MSQYVRAKPLTIVVVGPDAAAQIEYHHRASSSSEPRAKSTSIRSVPAEISETLEP